MIQDNPNFEEYKERLTSFSQEFDLGLFIHLTKKSLIWVFGVLMISIVSAKLYLNYTPQVYQAKSILQLEANDAANKVLNVNPLFNEESSLEAKVELIRSKLLIKQSLSNLPLEIGYYAIGEILTNEHYLLSPYRVEIIERKTGSIEETPVFVNYAQGQFKLSLGSESYENIRPGETVDLPWLKFKMVVINEEELESLSEEYSLFFKLNNVNKLVARFSKSMDVRILNNTAKTIQISVKDNNPYIARDIVSAISNEFIRFDLEKKQRSDDKILSFIDNQIDTVFDRLKSSEIVLNNYKQENKISDLSKISGVYLDRLNDLENRLIELEVENRLLNEVEQLSAQPLENVSVFNIVPLVAGSKYEKSLTRLLDNLNALHIRREEALFTVTEDNNIVESLEYQIGIQKNLILQTIVSIREKISAEAADVTEKLAEVENVYFDLPSKELEYARLNRLFTINEKYYTMLLEKRIEYQISKEGFVTQNQILEDARVPFQAIYPKKNTVAFGFVLAGLIIGFLIITIKYLLHNQISSLNEINRLSNSTISTLGVVPMYKETIPVSMLLVNGKPRSLFAEAFRNIRTNLRFIDNSEGPKVAAVTSTISGEGKTLIAINLAGIVAYSGKKVILLDLDMRRPKINKGFGVDNNYGMSTVLIGKSTIKEAIRHSDQEGLDFITAGPIPPNPSELIISERMGQIIEELKLEYDMVVIDTPPVGLVTDGVTLIQKADYPLYIFRADYSKKHFVQNVDRLINENGIKSLSVVLNGIDLERSRYGYNYGYGYSYGYGYGSGYYDEASKKKVSVFKKWFKK
ncbi:MAG: polysaccharide biosynthesis tyrosine autokinase [Flavobacteriales bacterium]|nr:polysaccharide biosynthesis tyrosine autokinase [Flavobacteriaceae bacterium]MDG1767080.1 polysaccharide biosynthesis tyrosine autokinase [Flavobacteriales bacterium]